MSKLWRYTLPLLLTAVGQSVAANEPHPLSDIAGTAAVALHERALNAGYHNLEVEIRPLDARLQLARCDKPLSTLPANSDRVLGPVSVGVRCGGLEPWTLYVRGQVSASMEVPVLAASVGRGELVSTSDINMQLQKISGDLDGIISNIDDIVGMEAKRSLTLGDTLRFSDLKAPQLIERGQSVAIVSTGAGLRVSMQGKALANGGAGDRILVANVATGKRVEGVVSRDGSVLVQ